MSDRELPLPFPFGGLNDDGAHARQPPFTTRRAKNVRGIDPSTGRVRGAQRSGLSRFVDEQIISTPAKIQHLTSITYDQRTIDYGNLTDPVVDGATVTPLKQVSRNGVIDRQSNIYALDGKGALVKYNSELTQLWSLVLPVEDTEHVVRALWVDEFDFIYMGVSEGGKQEKAAIWGFEPKLDTNPTLLFTIKPGGYCEALETRDGKLYAALNYSDRGESVVIVYDRVDSSVPGTVWSINASHPLNDLATKTDGSVVITSEPIDNDVRGKDPRYPDLTPKYRFWTPDAHLTSAEARIWSWYDAEQIAAQFGFELIQDDDEVTLWEDISGNGRHLFPSTESGDENPKYTTNGLAGIPGVRFDGTASALMSAANQTRDPETKDDQKTCWPTWGDLAGDHATFLWCFIFRADSDAGERGVIFATDNQSGGTFDRRFIANGDEAGTAAGKIAVVDEKSGGGVNPVDGQFDNRNGVAIVTLLAAGDGTMLTGGETTSTFRVNGQATEAPYTGKLNRGAKFSGSGTLSRTWVGHNVPGGAANGRFNGYLMEAICLQAYTDEAGDLTVATYEEIELIEGYLAWKYGVSHLLEDALGAGAPGFGTGFTAGGANSTAAFQGNVAHAYVSTEPDAGAVSAGQNVPTPSTSPDVNKLTSSYGVIAKFGPTSGDLVWAEIGDATGGTGYSVAVDDETGNVYTVGPDTPAGTAPSFTKDAVMWTDDGDGATVVWSADVSGGGYELEEKHVRIVADKFGNLHFPSFDPDSGVVTSYVMFNNVGTEVFKIALSDDQQAYAVAVDPKIPDYTGNTPAITRPEFVVLFTENNDDPEVETVHRLRLISTTPNSNPPRAVAILAVSDGAIKEFDDTTVTLLGAGTELSSTARYVTSAQLFGEIFFTDGVSDYYVYNPKLGTLIPYIPTSAGSVDKRAALIAAWRGAIVWARFPDDPHNWLLSKRGDPYNVDLFPPVVTTEQAVLGNDSRAGPAPDIINCLIPHSDDLLIFGCDHSLHQMTGDPAGGGQFDLLSDVTGVAFGQGSWAKDDRGMIYFFGSQGGVFAMAPGGRPEELTERSISRRLRDVDLGLYYPELVWNDYDDGLHVFIVPFGAGGTVVTHWFWERRTGAWWEDGFGVSGVQPTAAHVLDSDDPNDRTLLLGCEDSFIRRWDRDAVKDDQDVNDADVAIDSQVLMGPLEPREAGYEMAYDRLTLVLGSGLGGVQWRAFSSDVPDNEGLVIRSGWVTAGRNDPVSCRFRGSYGWIELRNARTERWTLEEALLGFAMAGVARRRR